MPLQKLSGVAIFVSLQECGFSRAKPYTGKRTLHSHATKLGLRSTSSNAITEDSVSLAQSQDMLHSTLIIEQRKQIFSPFHNVNYLRSNLN